MKRPRDLFGHPLRATREDAIHAGIVEFLTQERLKELLDYDPETGVFTARVARSSNLPVGARAGSVTVRGYVNIHVCNKVYYAHRLAWFYVHGRWPNGHLDHINRVASDNRIANLREATRPQNMANTPVRSHNKSGKKGVAKHHHKWVASICKHGRKVHLGSFGSAEEAHAAYVAAARDIHGEFARAE